MQPMGTESAQWPTSNGAVGPENVTRCHGGFISTRQLVRLRPIPKQRKARVAEVSSMTSSMISTGPGSRTWRWALGAVALVLGLAYAPNFLDLTTIWQSDPNYSHGYLVIPIALFILWRRLSDMPWEPSRDAVAAPW